jgi:hypothetical protein
MYPMGELDKEDALGELDFQTFRMGKGKVLRRSRERGGPDTLRESDTVRAYYNTVVNLYSQIALPA